MNPFLARAAEAGIGATIGGTGGGLIGALSTDKGKRKKRALIGAGVGASLGAAGHLGLSKAMRGSLQHLIGRTWANEEPIAQKVLNDISRKAIGSKLYGGGIRSALEGTMEGIRKISFAAFQDELEKISFSFVLREYGPDTFEKLSPKEQGHILGKILADQMIQSGYADKALKRIKKEEAQKAKALPMKKLSAYYLANDMSPEEMNTLLGKPTLPVAPPAKPKKKLAAFGGFADPRPKGFASPPKSNPAQDMNAQAQAQKAQLQVQMAQQQGAQPQKTAGAEPSKDNDMTKARFKQFLKNLAVVAPATAVGIGLGHLAGDALRTTRLGNYLQHSAGGTIPHAIGAVALTTGALALRSMIDNMADKKIREADHKGKLGVR